MLPQVPVATIRDLARAHAGANRRPEEHARLPHPDGFLADEEMLRPDPVFHVLRAMREWGPIGALRRWIDRKVEEHEDRRVVIDAPQDFIALSNDNLDDDLAA